MGLPQVISPLSLSPPAGEKQRDKRGVKDTRGKPPLERLSRAFPPFSAVATKKRRELPRTASKCPFPRYSHKKTPFATVQRAKWVIFPQKQRFSGVLGVFLAQNEAKTLILVLPGTHVRTNIQDQPTSHFNTKRYFCVTSHYFGQWFKPSSLYHPLESLMSLPFKRIGRSLRSWALGLWDSLTQRLSSCLLTLKDCFFGFFAWHSSLRTPIRIAADLGLATILCLLAPIVAVGLAACCFVDRLDSVGSVLSLLLAAVCLELLALWAVELLIPLVALQLARVTTRFLDNVQKRELATVPT